MRRNGIWETAVKDVHVPQKVWRYQPKDKLLGVLITILAGARGLVESKTLVRPDQALQRAFGLEGEHFPEQSTLSETLNACGASEVAALRGGIERVYQCFGRAMQHAWEKEGWLILDVDLTGMPCGRKGEKATKGYFSGHPGCRGRQLGRVVAAQYQEIVTQSLYDGKKQLTQAFQPLTEAAAHILGLDRSRKKREETLLRCDAGAGTEREINWALNEGYGLLTKLKSHQRSVKLVRSVTTWYPDPKVRGRSVGWIEAPHAFARETLQVAIRSERTVSGKRKRTDRVLLTSLSPEEAVALMGAPIQDAKEPDKVALAVAHLYDQRGGGVETENRQDKQGLGLTRRNKKRFHAQEMLVLLAQLAHNMVIWVLEQLKEDDPHRWRGWGIQRMIRDLLQVQSKLTISRRGRLKRLILRSRHPYAKALLGPLRALAGSKLYINLGKI